MNREVAPPKCEHGETEPHWYGSGYPGESPDWCDGVYELIVENALAADVDREREDGGHG